MLRYRLGERCGFVRHDRKLSSPPAGNLLFVVAHALTPDPVPGRVAAAVALPAAGRRYRGLSAEERRADQRRRLVRAAIEEFAARGYHHTSVEDIVRSARTSRTAFYAFFDNREDAMYGAVQTCLRSLLDAMRAQLDHASPDDNLTEVGVRAYVECLVADPAAARVILLEGVGTSPEVNALRSRIRRELADLIRDLWARSDPQSAASAQAAAISVGVFGILFESMVHLAETNRLDEAPAHVPALVTAIDRVLASPPAG
jgi:AcrR family transcriptional regulator